MEIKIDKICYCCNKEFELKKVEHNNMTQQSIANFENCPHCGTRNDHWIKIEWPKFT